MISRGLNTLIGKGTGRTETAETAVKAALDAYRGLPEEIERLNIQLNGLQNPSESHEATEALLSSFRERIEAISQLGKAAEQQLGVVNQSQKFWSGLSAEIASTLLVTSAAAIASKRFGLPLNAATATAGFLVGGATNVGAHALLDNQYNLKKEGLGNFVTAGLSTSALVLTANQRSTSLKRMAAMQVAVAGATTAAGAMTQEYQTGFQKGWQTRVATGTLIGVGVGAVSGAAGSSLMRTLPQTGNTIAQKALVAAAGAATGGVSASASGVLNEATHGFKEGWQSRVKQQALGGVITGAVMTLAPTLKPSIQELETETPIEKKAPLNIQDEPDAAIELVTPSESETGVEALSYANNEKIQAFDKQVTEYSRKYDNLQPQNHNSSLLNANGVPVKPNNPTSGYGVGYSTAPKLLKPDGTPVKPDPYGSPPPPLLKADGNPVNPNPYNTSDPYSGPLPLPSTPTVLDSQGAQDFVEFNVSQDISIDAIQVTSSVDVNIKAAPRDVLQNPSEFSLKTYDANQATSTAIHEFSAHKELMSNHSIPGSLKYTLGELGLTDGTVEPGDIRVQAGQGKLSLNTLDPAIDKFFNLATASMTANAVLSGYQSNPIAALSGTSGISTPLPSPAPNVSAPSTGYGSGYGNGNDYGMPAPAAALLDEFGKPLDPTKTYQQPYLWVKEDGTPFRKSLKDEIYTDIFNNNALRDTTVKTFTQWTSTYSDNNIQKEMRDGWKTLLMARILKMP